MKRNIEMTSTRLQCEANETPASTFNKSIQQYEASVQSVRAEDCVFISKPHGTEHTLSVSLCDLLSHTNKFINHFIHRLQ